MNTLTAMVSIGDRDHLTDVSYRRLYRWASTNGYDCVLIKDKLHGENRSPHYSKLRVPDRIPGYDRYCIVDDDLLMSSAAPSLPDVKPGHVGLCRDPVQSMTSHDAVGWTANTGFILAAGDADGVLNRAYERGDEPNIWPGFGDQSALNLVGWQEGCIQEIDTRWNTLPVISYFINGRGWDVWTNSRPYRLSFYTAVALRLPGRAYDLVEKSWGLHMVLGRYPKFFDHVLD